MLYINKTIEGRPSRKTGIEELAVSQRAAAAVAYIAVCRIDNSKHKRLQKIYKIESNLNYHNLYRIYMEQLSTAIIYTAYVCDED